MERCLDCGEFWEGEGMSEWKNCTLGDFVALHYGKALRSDRRTNGSVPVFSSAGSTGCHDEPLVESKGLIIGRKGTVGKVYFSNRPFWCIDTAYYVLPNDLHYDLKYLYFLLQTLGLEELNEDSAVPGLNRDTAYQQNVLLPALPEQKAIASVLSSLDDKIDLLHRQNKTLEALAETLFRQWFVEEAQEDWEVGNLGYFAVNPKDGVRPSEIDSETRYIGLEHIDRRSIALIQLGSVSDVTSNKFQFFEDDILFGKLRPYFHKVCFAPYSGVCSTDILVIRPKKPNHFAYCLFAFYQSDVVEYANLGSGGTRMPRTNWETLSQYPVFVPDDMRLCEFNNLVIPAINKIKQNIIQIHTLEKLRDTLLPKLMSGEVRVAL
jgi:type I restriction enzyme, S subunit